MRICVKFKLVLEHVSNEINQLSVVLFSTVDSLIMDRMNQIDNIY